MDQREPPGIGVSPAEDAPPRRFPRLMPPPTVRRLAPGRLALACVGVICALAVVSLSISQLVRGARRYVDGQSVYRLSYRDLILDPPAPPWYRGGSEAFLERALGGAGEFQSFSALDFDADRLLLMFRRYAWVEKGLRVEVGHPNRVVIRLEFREPVAVERLPDATEGTVVDGEGVVLPRNDVDFERVGPLVRLYGFSPPADPRAGLPWNRIEPAKGLVARDNRVRDAARLAAFLRNGLRRDSAQIPAPRFVVVHPWGDDGFSVQVGANLTFKWDEPGAGDAAGRLTDEAKWAMLLDRVRRVPPRVGDPWMELKFTRDGVEVDDVHDAPRQATQRDTRFPLHRTTRTQTLAPSRDKAGN